MWMVVRRTLHVTRWAQRDNPAPAPSQRPAVPQLYSKLGLGGIYPLRAQRVEPAVVYLRYLPNSHYARTAAVEADRLRYFKFTHHDEGWCHLVSHRFQTSHPRSIQCLTLRLVHANVFTSFVLVS